MCYYENGIIDLRLRKIDAEQRKFALEQMGLLPEKREHKREEKRDYRYGRKVRN